MSTKRLNPMPKNLMFALDIGTRSVVGVISRREGKKYTVVDYEIMEHPDRAMFDGQIHDIIKVTEVVKTVVEALENRNGFKLEQAAIAAAGRALRTERATYELEIDITKEVDKSITDSIEMQAIQLAQKKLSEDKQLKSSYYCVGYSVINFYLDGAMILNPIGHRGGSISIDIIATFLPHIVVDSLYSVIHKAGLEVMNLTLEPIAAMNVAIPKNLRLLNLALVDVGAGTSDIAISKDGSVVSYGMVALAGDELTEKIAQTYLLDFNGAEKLKIGLGLRDTHQFKDVLGLVHQISTEEVCQSVDALIQQITKEIAENIIQLNKKSPSAVFCIGGGAQIPGFTKHLAAALSLPVERVVIKSAEMLDMVDYVCAPLSGPEFVTPIGIGITAFEERDQDFIQVNVNETAIRLFNSKPLMVSDALILTGFSARSLISERGESFNVTVNGEVTEIKGDYGEPAHIYINSIPAHLDSKINHKDQITVIPAEKGKARKLHLKDLVRMNATAKLNNQEIRLVEFVSVNGVNRTGDYIVIADDVVETKGIRTAMDLAKAVELDMMDYAIYDDKGKLDWQAPIKMGGQYRYEKTVSPLISDVDIFQEPTKGSLNLLVNGSEVTLPITKNEMVFVDVFDHIAFDISKPQGILILKLNGERARYTDALCDGDVIDIYWNN